jgi:hypothetical protein
VASPSEITIWGSSKRQTPRRKAVASQALRFIDTTEATSV